jgi:hypothetical protein
MISDDDGHYEFGALAAGEYRVSAGKSGYTSLTFGQHTLSDPGQPLVFTGPAKVELTWVDEFYTMIGVSGGARA